MSISTKALRELRKGLGRGGYRKVAIRINCTPDWVGQVLRSAELCVKHNHIVETALVVIAEEKQNTQALNNKILEALK